MITIELEKNLATRESARVLFKKLLEKNIKTVDFKHVKVVSRSFANEIYKLETENNFILEKLNMSKETQLMFDNADKKLDTDILSKNNYKTVSLKDYSSLI